MGAGVRYGGRQKFGRGNGCLGWEMKGARWIMLSVGRPRIGSESGRLDEGMAWRVVEGERQRRGSFGGMLQT